MSRGSFGRTVARAAASGGSKNYRARPPILWYLAIALIVLAGSGLIAYSRNEAVNKTASASAAPTASDNWYTALAFDVCGTLQAPLPANTNLTTAGIRTFGDGIINTNPGSVSNSSAFTGANATLGTFVATYGHGLTVAPKALALPLPGAVKASTSTTTSSTTSTSAATTTTTAGAAHSTTSSATAAKSKAKATATTTKATGTTTKATGSTAKVTAPAVRRYTSGARCTSGPDAGKTATVQVETWSSPTATGTRVTGDPSAIRLTNGGMITVAFVPSGSTIPAPRSKSTLLQDLGKK